jgi:Pretoxin HINT domain
MNRDHNEVSIIKRMSGRTTIVLLSLATAMFAWPYIASALRPASLENSGSPNSASDISAASSKRKTAPIEGLKVGDRVIAHNPQISAEERAKWTEPHWPQWLHLSLTMRKSDGTTLNMELLRPESWVREQVGLVVQAISNDRPPVAPEPGPNPETSSVTPLESNDGQLPYSPLRPIFRDLAITGGDLAISGKELHAILIDMDLPELAITGPAVVHEIQNAPPVNPGDGRVVTATFRHSSGDVIDLVVGDASATSQSTIGTTSNHPFWSQDRQQYIQAGQLAIGERLQTHSGDTKRVVSKLARPGPEPVYNLEVFAEHVYYVGEDGLLVHNSGPYAGEVTVYRIQPRVASGIVTGGAFRRTREGGTNLVQSNAVRQKLLDQITSTDPNIVRRALVDAQASGAKSPIISTTFNREGALAHLASMRARGLDVELVTITGPRAGGIDFNSAFEALGGRTKRLKDQELEEFGILDLFIPSRGTSRSGFRIIDRQ